MKALKVVLPKLPILIFALFVYFNTPIASFALIDWGGGGGGTEPVMGGVQLPSEQALTRLHQSQFKATWIKFQYSLGSNQPLEEWIRQAKDKGYYVLISVAKNKAGIETLQDPDYPPLTYPEEYTHQYCPWDEELEIFHRSDPYDCTEIPDEANPTPTPKTCYKNYDVKATLKADNGYVRFRDEMKKLAPRLEGADAVEIWNEPNLADEWTNQGLGPVKATRYANFLKCGVKGLDRGGYSIIGQDGRPRARISAALAPLAPYQDGDDITYFKEFVGAGGLDAVTAIGWHSNILENIPPYDPNPAGFQRFRLALNETEASNKPLWLTEFGWRRDKSKGLTCQIQSRYINQAYRTVGDDESLKRVQRMIVWNFGFGKENPDPDFKLWDIEQCQIDPFPDSCVAGKGSQRSGYPDTGYVTDPTSSDDAKIMEALIARTLPEEVSRSADKEALKTLEVKVDVEAGFFIFDIIGTIKKAACANFSIFCTPTLSVVPNFMTSILGKPEDSPSGRDTAFQASRSALLGKTMLPEDLKLIPPQKDCNFVKEGSSSGDKDYDTITNNLDYVYGAQLPPLEDLSQDIEERMKKDNVSIGKKLFDQDKRGPVKEFNQQYGLYGSYYPPLDKLPLYIPPPP